MTPPRYTPSSSRHAGVGILTNQPAIDAQSQVEDGSSPGPALLTVILAAILLARLLAIVVTATDLHYEEAQHWFWSRSFDFGDHSRPPIFMWLIGLATSLCGDGVACIRFPSPIMATAAAFLVYALADRLYDRHVAFWAAIVYATLPAVSAFAMVMMPEGLLAVLLIAGLFMLSVHFDRPSPLTGLALGIVVGLGLLADSAMAYLPICAALYVAATRSLRPILRAPGTWLAIAVALVIVAPTLLWNAQNEFSTLAETLSLQGWSFERPNADSIIVFVVLQFVLFGPILLFVLLRSVLARRTTSARPAADRFLLFHSIPILLYVLFEAVFFKGLAHWTLPAYPAAAIFVTALLLRHDFRRLLMVSTGLHVAGLLAILGFSVFADRFADVPAINRLVGWKGFAENLADAAGVSDVKIVILRGGDQVSESIYYLRDGDLDIRAFKPRGRVAEDDFERRQSWAYGDPDTILLATRRDPASFGIPPGGAEKLGEFQVPLFLSRDRIFALYRVNPPAENTFPQ